MDSELVAGYATDNIRLKVFHLLPRLGGVEDITRLPRIATGITVSLGVQGGAEIRGFLRSPAHYFELPEHARYVLATGLFSFTLESESSRKLAENLKQAGINSIQVGGSQTDIELDRIVQSFLNHYDN